MLQWTFELQETVATRLMSTVGSRLSESAWSDPTTLRRLSRVATRTLGVGDVRLTGRAPNGQCYMMAPRQLWVVADSNAVVQGRDLGPSGPLLRQARLGDFRMPQRGIGMVGSGHFETFDPDRHRTTERAFVRLMLVDLAMASAMADATGVVGAFGGGGYPGSLIPGTGVPRMGPHRR